MYEALHRHRFDEWFLTPSERGNAATAIDRRRGDGRSWTERNRVEVLIDGAGYFSRLRAEISTLDRGDCVHFMDWEGHSDELLDGPGSEVGRVLADAAERGTRIRGLLWRSHPRRAHFSEPDNASLAKRINATGGEILLDERVRRGGSHHQKLVVIQHAAGSAAADVAYEGGIDLCHGRHDDPCHGGDPQVVDLDKRYGARPPWHDVQLEVRGPAIGDLAHTFLERWNDPTPLDHHNPLRFAARLLTHEPRHPKPATDHPAAPQAGTHAVQVLRTYPAKRPGYPFAPKGERSIARAYLKAIRRARKLVYLEDQYLWSEAAAHALADALRLPRGPARHRGRAPLSGPRRPGDGRGEPRRPRIHD